MSEQKQTLGMRSAAMVLAIVATFLVAGCGGTAKPSANSTNPFGLPTAAVLSISNQSLSFGEVTVGTATSQLLSVTNTGTDNLKISAVHVSGQGYTVSGGSNATLTPNQSVTISVNFGPSTSGYAGGTLAITSDASNPVVQVGVSGTGVTGQQSGHGVSLSWTPSSSNVIGYFVYRSTVSGGPYTKVNATVDSQPTFMDSGLASGVYYYVVTSVDSSGVESGFSNEVQVVVP
ncbi:MAG TPA: choice-of-anchor D domain-containing protein [Candidatus Acidoferrales bacterium]|jgi:hypothetical protein|nr:choice-of-anchor D domain-containing protein [Candidatus Acidoferrales bacterium]